MVVEEDIRLYKDSWAKRQILSTWERMRKRAGAMYGLATEENYQCLKPLLFQVFEEEFSHHPRTEMNLHACISHCAWMADYLGKRKEMVYWLEIQDFLVALANFNQLEKNEEGILI